MKNAQTMHPGDIWYNDWASCEYDYRIFLVTRPLGKGVFEIVFRDGTKSRHDSYSARRDPDRYRLIGHVDLKDVIKGIFAPYAPDGSLVANKADIKEEED